jgi:hypothetical protein
LFPNWWRRRWLLNRKLLRNLAVYGGVPATLAVALILAQATI